MAKKGSGPKGLDAEGEALWHHVIRSVTPYAPPSSRTAKTPGRQKTPKPKPAAAATPSRKLTPTLQPVSALDRATETKLKRGRLTIEGRLDLHGMTQSTAHKALIRFVQAAYADDQRTLLVITGKGARQEGVLRRMLPLWLETDDLAPYVLAFSAARPQDGGAGAFYLRLRKKRGT